MPSGITNPRSASKLSIYRSAASAVDFTLFLAQSYFAAFFSTFSRSSLVNIVRSTVASHSTFIVTGATESSSIPVLNAGSISGVIIAFPTFVPVTVPSSETETNSAPSVTFQVMYSDGMAIFLPLFIIMLREIFVCA